MRNLHTSRLTSNVWQAHGNGRVRHTINTMGRLLSEKDTINYDNAMPYDEERDSTKLTKG